MQILTYANTLGVLWAIYLAWRGSRRESELRMLYNELIKLVRIDLLTRGKPDDISISLVPLDKIKADGRRVTDDKRDVPPEEQINKGGN